MTAASHDTRSTEALPATNHVYVIHWRARDIGYGVEEGITEAVYRGPWGEKHEWQTLSGSPTLYLFSDEVLSIAEETREEPLRPAATVELMTIGGVTYYGSPDCLMVPSP